jgi:hypothetical protein
MDWISAAIGGVGILLSAFIASITATWVVGSKMTTRDELEDLDRSLTSRLDKGMHDYGEALAAIRQKIEQVEMYMRDHYADVDTCVRIETDLTDVRRRLESLPGVLVKVDTLWSFVIDRGKLEAKDRGFMQSNSPLTLTEAGKRAIAPILPTVTDFCKEHPEMSTMNEDELASLLVKQFEPQLVKEVCEPNHIYLGACIVLLMEALRVTNVIHHRGTHENVHSD